MNWEINSLPVELTLSVPLIKKSKIKLKFIEYVSIYQPGEIYMVFSVNPRDILQTHA